MPTEVTEQKSTKVSRHTRWAEGQMSAGAAITVGMCLVLAKITERLTAAVTGLGASCPVWEGKPNWGLLPTARRGDRPIIWEKLGFPDL